MWSGEYIALRNQAQEEEVKQLESQLLVTFEQHYDLLSEYVMDLKIIAPLAKEIKRLTKELSTLKDSFLFNLDSLELRDKIREAVDTLRPQLVKLGQHTEEWKLRLERECVFHLFATSAGLTSNAEVSVKSEKLLQMWDEVVCRRVLQVLPLDLSRIVTDYVSSCTILQHCLIDCHCVIATSGRTRRRCLCPITSNDDGVSTTKHTSTCSVDLTTWLFGSNLENNGCSVLL